MLILSNAEHTESSFKVESRSAEGEVRGVYSYLQPNGLPHTVAYIADGQDGKGFRTYPIQTVIPQLPPFPYSLQSEMAEASLPQSAIEGKAQLKFNAYTVHHGFTVCFSEMTTRGGGGSFICSYKYTAIKKKIGS